ncbi:hypothetical protein CGMCC3_g4208 [Colletotrichum fructicola]|nr:uncharacterized protein CGMCC3_g4208 [Colletotrichum fructicola]KAE9579656.1 hypothetical protein CGMCC3_g4208 [Colletotrichum fructicola]
MAAGPSAWVPCFSALGLSLNRWGHWATGNPPPAGCGTAPSFAAQFTVSPGALKALFCWTNLEAGIFQWAVHMEHGKMGPGQSGLSQAGLAS